MPKIRSLKPELLEDEALGRCALGARLMFIGMISLADDEGRLRATAAFLRSRIFPYNDDLTVQDVAVWVNQLAAANVITLYECEDQTFAHLVGWEKHQRISPSHFKQSDLPAVEDGRPLATLRESRELTSHGPYSDEMLQETSGKDLVTEGNFLSPVYGSSERSKEISGDPKVSQGNCPPVVERSGEEGSGEETTTTSNPREVALQTLRTADWPGGVDEEKVEQAMVAYPDLSAPAAALVAVTWRQRPGFKTEHAHIAFLAALRNEQQRRDKGVKDDRPAKVYDLRTTCRDCGKQLAQAERSSGRCDPCFEAYSQRVLGEDGAA